VVVLFAAVPAVIYQQFLVAEEERTALLLDSVANQGQAIAEALRPVLEAGDPSEVTQVGERMARLASRQVELRLLFRPRNAAVDSFLLVAAVPPVPPESLESERRFFLRSHCWRPRGSRAMP